MKQNNYVIKPLSSEELSVFLDEKSREVIKYFITKSLFAQPEPKVGQKLLPIQIPKEHIEQWFTQSMNVKSVGAGSHPIDIYNENEGWGADIKMLNMKIDKFGTPLKTSSGEASLGQKFEGPGINLDSLFGEKRFTEIKDLWIELYRNKYDALKSIYPIKKVYYFFILRPSVQLNGADFYFCGAVLDFDNIGSVDINVSRTTSKSVFLTNFIDDDFGNTKIYKAKKRLELRLNPQAWIQQKKTIKIQTSFVSQGVDLRNIDDLNIYLGSESEKMKKIIVKFMDK